jgi:small-conductance mechanosensitive channel
MVINNLSSYDIAIAAAVAMLVLLALVVVRAFAARQLHHLSGVGHLGFLNYPEQILNATRLPFMLGISLLAGASQLDLTPRQEHWLHYGWVIVLALQVALWANRLVTVAIERAFVQHRQTNPAGATHLMVAGLIARIVLWSVAVLAALDNLGINITTLMASLGIGGIAVALAVQNILGDIFSSVSIALDKPFVIGDFIVVDDYMGTVEYVGLKTTRILSLGGEQIVFSNSELLKNRIRNYKRMQERRVQFQFGVAYETPLAELEAIPRLLEDIVRRAGQTRFDRAHFKACGDSALQFEVVYYVLDPDYNKYMDIQQAINCALLAALRERKVAFAYPTRTLYLATTGETGGRQAPLPVPTI